MAEISFERDGNIDIIYMAGMIEEKDLVQLGKTISTLRQQGCVNLLWVGKDVERLTTRNLEAVANPMKIFRSIGGKIAVAEFDDHILKIIQRTSWKKYLNVFKTESEAKTFLDPKRSD